MPRLLRCGGWRTGLVVVLTLCATGAAASAAATAPIDETRIDVTLVAPDPTVATPRLMLGTADVTDLYCVPGTESGGDPSADIGCRDLPEGTYSVELDGLPAGVSSATECIDVVAANATNPTIGGGFTQWSCWVYVIAPGAVLGPEVLDNVIASLPEPPRVVLTDAAGEVVSDDCVDVRLFGADRRWCDGLPAGTYTADLPTVANGYRGSVGCHPYPADVGFGADVMTFTIDDQRPLWSCGRVDVFAPLAYTVEVDTDEPVQWLNGIETVVQTPAGDDVDATCSILQVVEQARGFMEIECRGLDDGEYRIAVYGLPEGYRVAEPCDSVVVASGAPGVCSVRVARGEGPAATAPPDEDDTGVDVPVEPVGTADAGTGAADDDAVVAATSDDDDGGGGLVWIGAAVIAVVAAAGAWLLTRRRRSDLPPGSDDA